MVIADIFIVLDGYHPPQLARFDNLPDSAEKGGVAQHMTHCHHLIRVCSRAPAQVQQLIHFGGDWFFQNDVIAFFQKSHRFAIVQRILRSHDSYIRQAGLLHQFQIGFKQPTLWHSVFLRRAQAFFRVRVRHSHHCMSIGVKFAQGSQVGACAPTQPHYREGNLPFIHSHYWLASISNFTFSVTWLTISSMDISGSDQISFA